MKPKFLFHGSRYKLEILKPQQAKGSPSERGDEFGIYAYEDPNMVIPFAMTILPHENGYMSFSVDDETGEVTISAGIIDEDAVGYIYKISSEKFEKIDKKQWLSKEEHIPLEITVINSKDYMHRVTFSGSAKGYKKM